MLPYKLLSFTTAVGCTILLTLAALAVSAQGVDVTAICPGGDGSRPVKLAPADSHTMEISCEESSETCRIKHTVTMNEEAGTTLCVTANGAPYTVTVGEAVAMQTQDSALRPSGACSRMVNDTTQKPNLGGATFRNQAVGWAWGNATGSIVTVSVCGNPERDVLVCGSGGVEAAKTGAPQLCGDAGLYQAVYTGTDSRSTNGCIGSAVRLYFTIMAVPREIEYTIYELAFDEPVVTSVVNLNGTQQTVSGSDASDVSVRITVDTPNPLEGYFMATQGRSNPPVVGRSRMLPGSCTGYCALRKDSETQYWLPMSTVCAGANPDCDASTTDFCEARVQLFTESSEDITLPYRTPDGTVEYILNDREYVVSATQGSAVPLKGVFVFNETAGERVTVKGAARDLSGAKIQVLPQDAQHKDVVVVRAGGEVVAASSACKFALRSVRGTDRMYSVTNVLGEPTCDLVIGNGVEQRTFNVDTPAKASGAQDVENVDALWNEVVDEGGKKNLPLILGLSLGLGILFVGIVAIVVGLCCCRRRKTCCFAEDNECPAWLTTCSRRATDCCAGNSTDEDEDDERETESDRNEIEKDAASLVTENPLEKHLSSSATRAPKVSSTTSVTEDSSKHDTAGQQVVSRSASEVVPMPRCATEPPAPVKKAAKAIPAGCPTDDVPVKSQRAALPASTQRPALPPPSTQPAALPPPSVQPAPLPPPSVQPAALPPPSVDPPAMPVSGPAAPILPVMTNVNETNNMYFGLPAFPLDSMLDTSTHRSVPRAPRGNPPISTVTQSAGTAAGDPHQPSLAKTTPKGSAAQRQLSQRKQPTVPVFPAAPVAAVVGGGGPALSVSPIQEVLPQRGDAGDPGTHRGRDTANHRYPSPTSSAPTAGFTTAGGPVPRPMNESSLIDGNPVVRIDLERLYMGDDTCCRNDIKVLNLDKLRLPPTPESDAQDPLADNGLSPLGVHNFCLRYRRPKKAFRGWEELEMETSLGFSRGCYLSSSLIEWSKRSLTLKSAFDAVIAMPFTQKTFAVLYYLSSTYHNEWLNVRRRMREDEKFQ